MAESADIHVVEQGDGWEVWQKGDSMPLGTYATEGEALERAAAAAEAAGVQLRPHTLPPADEEPVV